MLMLLLIWGDALRRENKMMILISMQQTTVWAREIVVLGLQVHTGQVLMDFLVFVLLSQAVRES